MSNELIDMKFKELMVNHYQNPDTDKQLDDIDGFFREFGDDPSFPRIKRDFDLMKADAFEKSGQYEQALAIFKSLYETDSSMFKSFLAQRVATVLLMLSREAEAIRLTEDTLKDEVNFSSALDLIYWYVRNVEVSEEHLELFRDQIENIKAGLDTAIPEMISTLKGTILFLGTQRKAASRRYTDFQLQSSEASPEERSRLRSEFVKNEPMGYFRKMAEEY